MLLRTFCDCVIVPETMSPSWGIIKNRRGGSPETGADNGSMAWEWVAPVATATAATALGGAGIVFTWLTGKQGRDHAEAIFNQQLTHEQLLAKEAREQQRLENAYVDLLDMAQRVGHWAQRAYPIMDTNPPQSVPPLPSLVEQAHTGALVNAFGSHGVLERMETWQSVVHQMIATTRLIELEDRGINPTARRHFDLDCGHKSAQHAKPSPIRWQSNLDSAPHRNRIRALRNDESRGLYGIVGLRALQRRLIDTTLPAAHRLGAWVSIGI